MIRFMMLLVALLVAGIKAIVFNERENKGIRFYVY